MADVAAIHDVEPEDLEYLASAAWRAWENLRPHFAGARTEVDHSMIDMARGVRLRGRMDLLALDETGEPRICEWKSGFGSDPWQQLRAYALLALDLYPEAQTVYCVAVHLRSQQPLDGRRFKRGELLEWWDALVRQLKRTDRYSPGAHCRYCPRSYDCPAKTAILRQMINAASYPLDLAVLPEDPLIRGEQLAGLLERVRLLDQASELLREAIKADVVARGGSLPAGTDRELVVVDQQRHRIDYRKGWPVLLETLLTDADQCLTVSKTRAEELVRKHAPYRGGAKAVRELREALAANGALIPETVQRLEIRRAEKVLEVT